MSAATSYPLCTADDGTFWPWLSWPALRDWPEKESAVVVVPVAGFGDGGDDQPLDCGETRLLEKLAHASRALGSPRWLLVLPPVRFVAGPAPACAFAVSPPTAHRLLAEVVGSVAATGFRRILYFNASPWNEEVCAASARDLHVEKDLDMFCLHLASLGELPLDGLLRELHAWRRP